MNYKVVSQLYQPIFLSFSYLNSAQHNLVIEVCCALKRLFSILTYIYVPIELLDFSKMQNSIFIAQEIFRHLGLKINSLRKKDSLFSFYVYKTSCKKLLIMYKCKYQWLPLDKSNIQVHIYKKQKTIAKLLYIYTNSQTLNKKQDHLKNFWDWHLYI